MRAHFMCANYEEDNLGLRSDDLNKCSELTSSENDCPFLFFDILFHFILFYFIYFCLFAFSRTVPVAYGGSQARGLIGAVASGLHHSHSNAGSINH